jgi:hypothetical protein
MNKKVSQGLSNPFIPKGGSAPEVEQEEKRRESFGSTRKA